MYLLARCDGHRPYGTGYINYYINSYMNTFEKAELTASTRSIERFSKSGITIYNSEVLDMAGNKNKEKKNTNNCKELKKCYSLCK